MNICPVCQARFKQPQRAGTRKVYCTLTCQRRARYLRERPERLSRQAAWRAANLELAKEHRVKYKDKHEAAKRRKRAERRAEVARLRPRCVICSSPLPWHKPSFPLSATTCGDPKCAKLRIRWFGAQRPRKKSVAA